jgi:hypothetical protein
LNTKIEGSLSISGNKILKKPVTPYAPLTVIESKKNISEKNDEYLICGSKTQRDKSSPNCVKESTESKLEELKIEFPDHPWHKKSRSIIQTAISLGDLN